MAKMNKNEQMLGKWNQQIVRIKDIEIDAVIREGHPPEEALRMALSELLIVIAHKVSQAHAHKNDWFPMIYPMRLTLQSETCHWDFQLQLRLKNGLELEENPTD